MENLKEIAEDDMTKILLSEITDSRKHSQEKPRIEKCVQYISKYKEIFGMELLAQIVTAIYYESKSAKNDRTLDKKMLHNIEPLQEYLEKYVSNEKIETLEMKEIHNLL